ncbi:zinc-ribbon domain-containing protein [Kitasatospora sp. NBC_01300]|uniref:NADase-type glycan-binding domain-containing protein n=1 Tax=Kitasatospora sp. NBC_01300 TaxID=2903574 RepID=UPI00352D2453|nr:zinc ribbon domain-containing protein [Kitasatospora sp. NBC_01300]
MRTCPECGVANEDGDDFCGNCGAYLGWSGTAAATSAAPAPAAPASAAPAAAANPPAASPAAPPAGAAREESPARPSAAPAEPPAARPAEPARPPAAAPTPKPTPAAAPAPKPAPASEVPPVRPGAVPPQPTAARQPAAADPVAVQPAKPVAPRPTVRPAAADEAQVGPPCPRCGTPNRPDRKFCRRCAEPLTPTESVAALPWWRTRWPFRRRVRIGGSGSTLRRMIALLVLAALVVAGVLCYPAGRNIYEDVLDKLRDASAISPTGAVASAEVEGHPAKLTVDGLSNTYWGAPNVGDSISYPFARPFRLVDVIIHTGSSTEPQQFQQQARPTALDLRMTTSDGKVHEQKVTLNDKPGPQTVLTGVSDVVKVALVVRAAAGTGPGIPIALAEVEFFKR